MGACFCLGKRLFLHGPKISPFKGLCKILTSRGIDALSNDHKGLPRTDHDRLLFTAYGRFHRIFSDFFHGGGSPGRLCGGPLVYTSVFFCGIEGRYDIFVGCAVGKPHRVYGKIFQGIPLAYQIANLRGHFFCCTVLHQDRIDSGIDGYVRPEYLPCLFHVGPEAYLNKCQVMNLCVPLKHLVYGAAMMNAKRMAGIRHLVVVGKDKFLVGFEGDLFRGAVWNDKKFRVAHGSDVHGARPGGFPVELKQLDDAFRADLKQVVAQGGIFKKINVELVAPDFEGKILDPRRVDVSHHMAVFILKIINLIDHVGHGRTVQDIGDFQFHDFLFGKIQRHGPWQGFILIDDVAPEYGGQHDHPERNKRHRFWIRIAQPHIPEPLVKPPGDFHPGLHPLFRVEIVFFSEGYAVMLVKPVRIKTNPQGDMFFVCHLNRSP